MGKTAKDVKWCQNCGEGTVKADRDTCKTCGCEDFTTDKSTAPQVKTKLPGKKKGMKEKAKDKLAEHEAKKELKWRSVAMAEPGVVNSATDESSVSTEVPLDVKFKPLEGWVEHKDDGGGGKSATQKKLEEKARASLLEKVHTSITKKIMMTLLQVSSKIMEATETPMRSTGADGAGVVVNALNGILLGYFYGQNKKKQFMYLRRFASDQLTRNMATMFEASGDSAKAAAELVGQISGFLKAKEAMATDMITAEIQKLMEAEVDIPTPEGLDGAVDVEATKGKIAEMMKTRLHATKAQIDELMKTVSDHALKFAVSKMDVTVQFLIDAVTKTIIEVEQLYSSVKNAGKHNEDGSLNDVGMGELQDSVFEVVSSEYASAYLLVYNQVGGLVAVLDKLMGSNDEEEEQ